MTSRISYLHETWNPLQGCSPVSTGCRNCWAQTMGRRFSSVPRHPTRNFGVLHGPARWGKPRRIGVCFTGDLFHDYWSEKDIDTVMEQVLNPDYSHHRWLILTKRPRRMYEYCERTFRTTPLPPNVWLGVTIENLEGRVASRWGDYEFNDFTAHTWVSHEPLLGPVLLINQPLPGWVVVGCEAGPGKRPCDNSWVRQIVDHYTDLGVPVYAKQIRDGRRVVHDPAQFPADIAYRQYPPGLQI